MTLRKAYINLTITLLLIVMSIVLFILHVSSNYVFWYHIVFYVASGCGLILFSSAVYVIKKSHKEEIKHDKLFEWFDWLGFTCQSLSVILILFMFFFFSSTVKQSSMYPTLTEGDIIIASQFNYTPKRGDIIIINVDPLEHPNENEKLLVKRIAGMPGDHVSFIESPTDGGYKIVINGMTYRHEGTDYIARYVGSERDVILASLDDEGFIKADEYLVFGDNEANSKDSRNLGTFERDDIIGHVIFRLWPFGGLS